MKQRKRKHLILERLANAPWNHDNPRMWHTRKLKPCRVYSYGCVDCNAILFRKLSGRFPYNMSEFDAFCAKQEEHMHTGVYELKWSEILP